MELAISLVIVVLAAIVIMYACNSFDFATSYLGRSMPAGVKGATLNAIGSSLPELLTTSFLLFLYHDQDGFSAGIATCAGSAVFNAVVIPALCILAALGWKTTRSERTKDYTLTVRKRPNFITLDRKSLLRDGIFFITAELCLIYFLKDSVMVWWMGGALLVIYFLYFAYLMWQFVTSRSEDDEDDSGYDWHKTWWKAVHTLDFHKLLFNKQPQTTLRAWVVLAFSTVTIAGACYFLSGAVIDSAAALGVPAYFTAVILGAAATSVPDTVISMKDAKNGNFDDAISNAIGSNIFDICVCLGLPLLVYGVVYGDVALSGIGSADVQALRIGLLTVTIPSLWWLLRDKEIRWSLGWWLLFLYAGWVGFILHGALT